MKRIYLFIFISIFFTQIGFSQNNRDEKIEALRVAFITRQLDLSPDEAKQFWPVHDNYQKEARKINMESRAKNGDPLELEEKMLDLRKKYKVEFLKVITEEKFNKLLRADREFKEIIRKEIERRKENIPTNRRGIPNN